jgi:exosortase A-associated hydrolase 2
MGAPAGTPIHFTGTRGPLFGVLHQPFPARFRGMVLLLPPWGEELNHTRRLVRQAATRMAEAGWMVLRHDPWGCGDSGGQLHEATWLDWQSDAVRAWEWLTRHAPAAHQDDLSHWVWGVRAGALMCAPLLHALKGQTSASASPQHVLWWQPVLHGKHMVQQWQRQRQAASWTRGDAPPSAAVDAQSPLWLGGQALSPDLLGHMQQCPMTAPPKGARDLAWLDAAAPESIASTPHPSPAQSQTMATWQTSGCNIRWQKIEGPNYWATLGLDHAPQLLAQTLACMDAAHASP